MKTTGSNLMILKRSRSIGELGGWHIMQLGFMLNGIIAKENWMQFLAFYIRGLIPSVRDDIASQAALTPSKINNAIGEALTIIKEQNNG